MYATNVPQLSETLEHITGYEGFKLKMGISTSTFLYNANQYYKHAT
jgi:hypothetical protein